MSFNNDPERACSEEQLPPPPTDKGWAHAVIYNLDGSTRRTNLGAIRVEHRYDRSTAFFDGIGLQLTATIVHPRVTVAGHLLRFIPWAAFGLGMYALGGGF